MNLRKVLVPSLIAVRAALDWRLEGAYENKLKAQRCKECTK
jgi:uncharacterized OB-fold protein